MPITIPMVVTASQTDIPMSAQTNPEITLRSGADVAYTGPKGDKGDTGNGISSIVLEDDYTLTITMTDGTVYHTESIQGPAGPSGPSGQDGQDGRDGFSPTVQIVDGSHSHAITITDVSGIHTATILDGIDGSQGPQGPSGSDGKDGKDGKDGQDGAPGRDGQDGQDGYSPSASVSKSGKVATITITDKSGTTTAQISDGDSGDAPVQSVNGKTGAVVLSASDVSALPSSTTIPSKTSDLTNDSGFLTAETDPTVPAWAKASSKPTYTASEVGALPDDTVIPTVPTNVSAFTNDAGYLTSYTETDPTVPSWAKESSKPTYTASEVGALPDDTSIPTKTSDLVNDSNFMSGMTILSYGHSTWADFIAAYTAKHVVYCRASSNSNPASGSQTRMAFMAYVSNADNPTNVEFQYYRSVNQHSATQQGDQVYVYKLDKSAGWTVTVREAMSKIAVGAGLKMTYASGTITISLDA